MSKIRVGALGNARILKRYIPDGPSGSQIEIESIATRSRQSAEKARVSYPHKTVFETYDALLVSQDIDAIYICVPSGLHFEWAKKGLEAGKHVLIEKPALLEADHAVELAALAKSKELIVMEAWWYRFHPIIDSIRQLISSSALGTIRLISSSFSYVNQDSNDSRWNKALGGGALNDMFCYHVDFLGHVMNIKNDDVALLQAFAHDRHGVDANIYAELVTSSGIICNLMSGISRPSMCKTFIVGDKGSLEIPHLRVLPEMGATHFTHHQNSGSRTYSFDATDAYALMFDAFAQAIAHGASIQSGMDEMIQNTHLMSRIRVASQEP